MHFWMGKNKLCLQSWSCPIDAKSAIKKWQLRIPKLARVGQIPKFHLFFKASLTWEFFVIFFSQDFLPKNIKCSEWPERQKTCNFFLLCTITIIGPGQKSMVRSQSIWILRDQTIHFPAWSNDATDLSVFVGFMSVLFLRSTTPVF